MEWGSWAGPWDGPLWFLRDLFVVMLFSPFIYFSDNKANRNLVHSRNVGLAIFH